MRRVAATIGLLGVLIVVVFATAAGDDGGDYKVRGIFDSGAFLVPGENVRIAGVTVGSVESTDVTMPDEAVHRDGAPDPGKAVVVMQIDDPGFQDFRQDASCLIRPQSVLGEKYIDCQPTQQRAPGSPPPPPLKVIADGEPGAGERFLPLENNGKEVDIDLVNNIMREPYADRFRLILNDLGAGLAARGQELQSIVERADPALRATNRVLAQLSRQNQMLSRLAADSDKDLAPLARERQHFAGFINNANAAAEATASRSRDLEAGFQRFPAALRQLRGMMAKLRAFSEQATPVFAEFRQGGPAIARSTRALGPFAHAATPALTTLGTASAEARRPIIKSDSIFRALRDMAQKAVPGAKVLNRLLSSLRETGFYRKFMDFLFFATGGINGYDQYGHFLRAWLLPNQACTNLWSFVVSFCDARFGKEPPAVAKRSASPSKGQLGDARALAKFAQSHPAEYQKALGELQAQAGGTATGTGLPLDAQGDPVGGGTSARTGGSPASRSGAAPSIGAARALLDTIIGRQSQANGGTQP
jgi:ABC-type transporter Mla subunit MlaD